MTWRICCVFLLAGPFQATGATATQGSHAFAHGFEIELQEPAPLYTMTLAAEVYRSSATDDLSDLAVFNNTGQRVPHLVRAPAPPPVPATTQWVSLPIFPVPLDMNAGDASITVQTDGTLIQIERANRSPEQGETSAYIIDASNINGRIMEIDLVLSDPGNRLVQPLAVERSSNLTAWLPMVGNFHVTALEYGGHNLMQTRIPIPDGNARYLRLRPLGQDSGMRLSAVRARVQTGPTTIPSFSRLVIVGTTALESPGEIHFDLEGHFPVRELAINFPANKLLQATVESRTSPSATWRRRHHGVFYALDRDGLLLRPNPVKLPGVRDRYWRLRDIEPDARSAFRVELAVAWKPQELIFLADGSPPFLLAVGRAAPQSEPASYAAALSRLADPDMSGHATIGLRLELGGEGKMTVPHVIPWRQIFLWGILFAGVATVGVMVVRLMRQMKT